MSNLRKQQHESVLHLAYLDGLRALLALYVVLHHTVAQFQDSGDSLIIHILFKSLAYGHYAVNFFIALSGFCLMLPVLRNQGFLRGGIGTFFKGRVRRILPAYYFAMALSLVFIYTLIGSATGTHWDNSIPVTRWDIISHIFLIQDIFTETAIKINHPFWSISVEWRIYFIFPILVYCFRTRGPVLTIISSLGLSLIALVLLSQTQLNLRDFGINPQYLFLFCLGMLAAYVSFSSDRVAVSMRNLIGWQSVLFVIAASVPLLLFGRAMVKAFILQQDFAVKDIVFGMWLYLALTWLALGKLNAVRNMLSWRPLVFLGAFAYSIYLIHAPLIQIIWQYILLPLNLSLMASVLFMLIVGTLLILGFSYLFFLVAERPFMNRKTNSASANELQVRWRTSKSKSVMH